MGQLKDKGLQVEHTMVYVHILMSLERQMLGARALIFSFFKTVGVFIYIKAKRRFTCICIYFTQRIQQHTFVNEWL